MWFCSSGFGPGPSSRGVGLTVVNGLAGPSIRAKKKAHTTNIGEQRPADTSGSAAGAELVATTSDA
jgi:hypothetical protein